MAGCGVQEVDVSVHDESIHQEKIERLKEIEAEHGGSLIHPNDIKDLDLRREYNSLKVYSLTPSHQDNVTGTVNVKDQMVSVLGDVFNYSREENQVTFEEADYPIELSTMEKSLNKGNQH